MIDPVIIEALAELEHEQWMYWSKAVAHEVSTVRRERWQKLWIPYTELSEEDKEHDRKWARIAAGIIDTLSKQQKYVIHPANQSHS
jgi:hypothetical protein